MARLAGLMGVAVVVCCAWTPGVAFRKRPMTLLDPIGYGETMETSPVASGMPVGAAAMEASGSIAHQGQTLGSSGGGSLLASSSNGGGDSGLQSTSVAHDGGAAAAEMDASRKST
mmetsp:Transcript_49239/g.137942  ORF Transcript_49239/g.137942 Transcript_49239/m.137942 type:complete len:115 (+) Transcript_49239:98-442(+)